MLNQVTIMGRLTKDPEVRMTQTGVAVASFTLAVERDYAANGEKREADFVDVVAWKGTAEFVNKYFTKGSLAVVSGRLQSRKFVDKGGNNRIAWEVIANSVYFGGEKKKDDGFKPLDEDDPDAPF